ncbi:hypothetical protein HDU82_008110 [Entophlyctis luteolus]|nr:hypothetical protein HDU82_008110 [Entophlyctis luteolus]
MNSLEALLLMYFEDDDVPDAAPNLRGMSKKLLSALSLYSNQQDGSLRVSTVPDMSQKQGSPSSNVSMKPTPQQQQQQVLPFRIWTDLSGNFKVEARFLVVTANMVTLERRNGEQMGIMMDKMSSADLDYILTLQQQGIDVRSKGTNLQPVAGKKSSRTPSPASEKQSQQISVSAPAIEKSKDGTGSKSTLPPGFIIPATALKIDLTPSGKLGSGTSGVVRRATYAGNPVAVKIISVRHLSKPQREAVIKEAEIMSRIVHPNAVRLFGVMIEEGLGLGLVMELLPSGCLKDWIETKPLPSLAQRIRLARDVSHAMAYLHDTLNMVHRDLKALNVLIDDHGVFLRGKVCDFGFAHVKSLGMESDFWNGPGASAKPNTEVVGGAIRGLKMQAAISMGSMTINGGMGTPLWMAPELFDVNALISKPADVFAFAIVMTEIFSWAGPYCIKYQAIIPIMQNVINLVQSGGRPDLALSVDVPTSIRSLIESGWDQNPDRRPTFRELTRQLEKAKSEADYSSIYAQFPLPTNHQSSSQSLTTSSASLGQVIEQRQANDQHRILLPTQTPQHPNSVSTSAPMLATTMATNLGSIPNAAVSPSSAANGFAPFLFSQFHAPTTQQQPITAIGTARASSVSNVMPSINGVASPAFMPPQQQQQYPPIQARHPKKISSLASIDTPTQISQQQQQSQSFVQQFQQLRPPSALDYGRPQSLPPVELTITGSKHPLLWDMEETAIWLLMTGEPADVTVKCRELQIDGKQLLSFSDRDFNEILGISDPARRKKLSDLLDDYRLLKQL